jgi:hypothetical protein
MGEQKKELTRKEKEKFIVDYWEEFKDPYDSVLMPVLSNLSLRSIDSMILYYQYLKQS